ncbi:MAG: lytic murein transglycosylase [Desulfobacteraceae bacterium]|nr:lytic murein transglycosylase [Desulfobacteraceae bacterium]
MLIHKFAAKAKGLALAAILLWVATLARPCAGQEPPPAPLAADLVKDGQVIDLNSPRYLTLFTELRDKYGFSNEELHRWFDGVSIVRRVLELMDRQAEALPYYKYYPLFIKNTVIEEGRRQLEGRRELLDEIEKKFGVEREIVVAIWGIESRFGNNRSGHNLFRTLNTLFDAYPRRRDFYRQQLIDYLLLCREDGLNPLAITGSYGGAFGQTQFIPSSFREYAVDFEHTGKRDVWDSVPDVLASIANYLHRFGWKFGAPLTAELGHELKAKALTDAYAKGRNGLLTWQEIRKLQQVDLPEVPEGQKLAIVGLELEDGGMRYVAGYPNFQVITKWNNSNRYAMAVIELAAKLKEK